MGPVIYGDWGMVAFVRMALVCVFFCFCCTRCLICIRACVSLCCFGASLGPTLILSPLARTKAWVKNLECVTVKPLMFILMHEKCSIFILWIIRNSLSLVREARLLTILWQNKGVR